MRDNQIVVLEKEQAIKLVRSIVQVGTVYPALKCCSLTITA